MKRARSITGHETVREILDAHPSLGRILAEAGLDTCCGGAHPIAFAARAHGVALGPLLEALNAALAGEKSV